MVTVATPQTATFWRHITARPYLYCLLTAGVFTSALILFEVGLTTIYIQAYPQDFFLELDGIYRLAIGQKIHVDFATPFGIALYAVPLLFVHSAGDLALSVNYASGLYLAVGFLVVWYLTSTRLSPVLGLALGIWIALALTSRMVTGGNPNVVTLAGNYNRNAEAAIALALLICRVPRTGGAVIALVDGVLYAFLTGFAFYTKITYGVVALTFTPVVIYPHRRYLMMFAGFVIAFGLLMLAIEYGYGTRFQWLPTVRMMVASGDSSSFTPIAQVVSQNLGVLLICILVPGWFLWRERRLTPWVILFFGMVVGAAIVLTRTNGSHAFLILPAILFFVVAPPALPWPEDRPAASETSHQDWRRYVLLAVTLAVVTSESAPEFANVAISAYRSLTEPPMAAGQHVLGQIVIRSRADEAAGGLKNKVFLDGRATLLDAFGIGRAFRPLLFGDNLTMAEFSDYLTDGMQAAREGCKPRDRILTMDIENPFPLLLGWPEGGGLIVLHPDRFLSARAHPSPENMFRSINCVLVPKLPVYLAARDFMLDVYGPYLSEHFPTVWESPLWRVLR